MRPFVLCGHVFRGFTIKDSNVFLVKTNEVFDGIRVFTPLTSSSLSFIDFLEWHNPLRYNQGQVFVEPSQQHVYITDILQTMAKWAARFALGLSNSVPLLALQQHCVEHEDDISLSISYHVS
jgi:hypothetical protein